MVFVTLVTISIFFLTYQLCGLHSWTTKWQPLAKARVRKVDDLMGHKPYDSGTAELQLGLSGLGAVLPLLPTLLCQHWE